MNYILSIGIGGFFGAIARYSFSKWVAQKWPGNFPVATFIINISGALMLGLLVTILAKFLPISDNLKVMLTTGFLGAYTTFSTFTFETISLIEEGEFFQAVKYIGLSVLLGILLAFGAVLLVEFI